MKVFGSAAALAAAVVAVVWAVVVGADDTAFCATVAAWPAGAAAALATASAWLLVPSGLVVCGGSTNGVTCTATCEEPA